MCEDNTPFENCHLFGVFMFGATLVTTTLEKITLMLLTPKPVYSRSMRAAKSDNMMKINKSMANLW